MHYSYAPNKIEFSLGDYGYFDDSSQLQIFIIKFGYQCLE